jgi:hypothetical protein
MEKTRKGKNGGTLGIWQPGESGNPKGPKPGYKQGRTILKMLLAAKGQFANPLTGQQEDMSLAEALHLTQIFKAATGDTRAYEAVMDRVDGRPSQVFGSDPDNPLPSVTPQIVFNVQSVEPITTEAALQKLLDGEPSNPI